MQFAEGEAEVEAEGEAETYAGRRGEAEAYAGRQGRKVSLGVGVQRVQASRFR